MPLPDNYSSSATEFAPPLDRFANVGKRISHLIEANAEEIRVESERATRKLDLFNVGAEGTQRIRAWWEKA